MLSNRWIPERIKAGLNEKQSLFLAYDGPEALYGGAAGGGKSIALLMGALQYVDYKGYHALILRRNFTQLDQPGALINVSMEWLANTDAVWQAKKHRWLFPSGATLTFGHMAVENDKYNYQSSEYHYVAYDELTQFMEPMYLYLFSRIRRSEGSIVPNRIRAACNPGGVGHQWVKKRFIPDAFLSAPEEEQFGHVWQTATGRVFIPAKLEDNPALDIVDYEAKLAEMNPVERAQLRHGDWKAQTRAAASSPSGGSITRT